MTDADPITETLRRAKAAWAADRFPAAAAGNAPITEVGTLKKQQHQRLAVKVPSVPTVTTLNEKGGVRGDLAEAMADWEERAAILEYNGSWSRAEAERRAFEEICRSLNESARENLAAGISAASCTSRRHKSEGTF